MKKSSAFKNIKEPCRKYRTTIKKKYPKHWTTIKFLTALIILALPLYAIMESSFSLYPLEKIYASAVQKTFELQGISANQTVEYETLELIMPVLHVEGFEPVGFGRACTGYRSILALFALIFAVPGIKISRKIKGFIVFLPIILIANYLRTYTTILSGILFGKEVFNLTHLILWREGLIFLILLLWFLWIRREKTRKSRK